jgi:hypothetical protein
MPSLPMLPRMPMSIAAADTMGAAPEPLPPIPMPPAGATPPPAMPPPSLPTPMAPDTMLPQGAQPAPEQSPAAPYQVRTQPDGSIVGYIPSPDGNPANDIIVGVHKPFNLPKPKVGPQGAQGAPQMDFSRAAMPPMQ